MVISKYITKKYKCQWCGFEFEKDVCYFEGEGKKANGSTQVICPECCQFIPTWKKEEIKEMVGRKHIHKGR